MRYITTFLGLTLLLGSCLPAEASVPGLHEISLYSQSENASYSYFYGSPGIFSLGERDLLLSSAESEDIMAVADALLVDGRANLRQSLLPLANLPAEVRLLQNSVDVEVRTFSEVEALLYFDGLDWYMVLENAPADISAELTPLRLEAGLTGQGGLTDQEAAMLQALLELRGPVALAFLPADGFSSGLASGIGEYRSTAIFVQEGIGESPVLSEGTAPPAARKADWQVLASGNQATGQEQAFLMITGDGEFARAWSRAYGTRLSPPPLPVIDFGRETVLAFFMGQQSSGGYGAEITGVTVDANNAYVSLSLSRPPAGSFTTQALTQPWLMIRVAATGIDAAWFRSSSENTLIGVARRF